MTPADKGDEILIYEPNRTLKEKLGPNVTFAQAVTPQAIEEAEKVIVQAADKIFGDNMEELTKLDKLMQSIAFAPPTAQILREMSAAAFAIKSKAGLCGYDFAAVLAKSLHLFCEGLAGKKFAATEKEIVACHVKGLTTVFASRIKGDGGEIGQTIIRELERLTGGRA
jgi:hypothetical protein